MLSGNQKSTDSLCNFITCRTGIELLQFHCNISISFPYLLQRVFVSDELECSYNINKGSIDSEILQGLDPVISMVFSQCASDCTFRRYNVATALIFPWAHSSVCVLTHPHKKQTKGKYSPSAPSAQRGVNDHALPRVNQHSCAPPGWCYLRCDSRVKSSPGFVILCQDKGKEILDVPFS